MRAWLVGIALLNLAGVARAQLGDPVPPSRPTPPPLFPELGPQPAPPPTRVRPDPLFPEVEPPQPLRPPPLFPNDGGDPLPGRLPSPKREPDSLLGDRRDRDDDYSAYYRIWWFPERDIRGQNAQLSSVRQELNVPIPIFLEKTDLFGATVRVRDRHTNTDAILPDTGNPYPSNLWDVSFGLGYVHRFDNGVSAGILPRVGSASDKPFQSTRELNFSAVGFVRVPAYYKNDYWNFSLFYFPNSQIRFPIPGVAYEYNPNPSFKASIGIPLSVRWRFAERWQFDFGYRPITQVTTRVTYEPLTNLRLYGGFEWDTDGYYLAGRPDRLDSFYLQEKRLPIGARFNVTDNISIDLSGGYAFDRRQGVGRNPLSYRYDRVNIQSGGYISAWVLLGF